MRVDTLWLAARRGFVLEIKGDRLLYFKAKSCYDATMARRARASIDQTK